MGSAIFVCALTVCDPTLAEGKDTADGPSDDIAQRLLGREDPPSQDDALPKLPSSPPARFSGLDIRSRTKEGVEDLMRLMTKKKGDKPGPLPAVCAICRMGFVGDTDPGI